MGRLGDAHRNVGVCGCAPLPRDRCDIPPTYREQSACHEGGGGRLSARPFADDDALDVPCVESDVELIISE